MSNDSTKFITPEKICASMAVASQFLTALNRNNYPLDPYRAGPVIEGRMTVLADTMESFGRPLFRANGISL